MSEAKIGLPVYDRQPRKKRVAIVSADIMGPIKNGGVGTACYALAQALALAGHETTVVFANWDENHLANFKDWQDFYYSKRIRLMAIPPPSIELDFKGFAGASYATYLFLKEKISHYQWDVIHFQDMHGLGYYTIQAKRTLGSFANTVLAVSLHGPTQWSKRHNHEEPANLDDLELNFLEQASIEKADALFLPTSSALSLVAERQIEIPVHSFIENFIVPAEIAELNYNGNSGAINELIFFGRLETRKNIELFIEAVKELSPHLAGKKVTFLGKIGLVQNQNADEYIHKHLANLDITFQIIAHLGSFEAIEYMSQRSCLAVVPSRSETLGYTVCECIEAKIPFLASRIPPFEELLSPAFHGEALFEMDVRSLKEKILHRLNHNHPPARRRIPNNDIVRKWSAWHDTVEVQDISKPTPVTAVPRSPLVSVCIAHRDRPHYLEQCMTSLARQTYRDFEILIGDDASELQSSKTYLSSLESSSDFENIRVYRFLEQMGPAAIRNRLVESAKGDHLLFIDDDNIANPNEIEAFVKAQIRTGADIITCPFDRFREGEKLQKPIRRWVPLGDATALGFFLNVFGDTNSLVKKSAFLAAGGFNETRNLAGEDWEFFVRATLLGFQIEVIPEPMFQYREHASNYSKRTEPDLSKNTLWRSYFKRMNHPKLADLLWLLARSTKKQLSNNTLRNHRLQNAMIYEDLFRVRDLYGTPLFKLAADFSEKATHNEQVTLQVEPEKVVFNVSGDDPIVTFSDLGLNSGKKSIIEVEMTASTTTFFTVYYVTEKNRVPSESQTISQPLRAGHNVFRIELNEDVVDPLRIDPACCPGVFELKKFEVMRES